jgi:hypothetical protein
VAVRQRTPSSEGISFNVALLFGLPRYRQVVEACTAGIEAHAAQGKLVKHMASVPEQRVAFGTSGHRGSAFDKAFNEWHSLTISQAICQYRELKKIDDALFLGMDTHALSMPTRG